MISKVGALALAVTLVVGGCARSPQNHAAGGETAAGGHGATEQMGREHDDITFGSPAAASEAARTIDVRTLDTLRFDPATIEVRQGEAVTFSVTNPGNAVHELTLGDAAFQAEHERDMKAAGSPMQDSPYSILVRPGETRSLTWRFTTKGEVLYGCHQPGHYPGGMVGKITVL